MISDLPVRRSYLILAHLMNGEPKPMKMPSCLKKLKRWHDNRIQKREFNVGDYLLLYNSRLIFFAGKLLSKWERPLRYRGGLSFRCHKNQQLRRHKSEGGERSKNQTNIISHVTLLMWKLILLRP